MLLRNNPTALPKMPHTIFLQNRQSNRAAQLIRDSARGSRRINFNRSTIEPCHESAHQSRHRRRGALLPQFPPFPECTTYRASLNSHTYNNPPSPSPSLIQIDRRVLDSKTPYIGNYTPFSRTWLAHHPLKDARYLSIRAKKRSVCVRGTDQRDTCARRCLLFFGGTSAAIARPDARSTHERERQRLRIRRKVFGIVHMT